MGGVAANLHQPASPSPGWDTTGAFARHDHPAGAFTQTVNGARKPASSKQQ
jgi:hypothetical protein